MNAVYTIALDKNGDTRLRQARLMIQSLKISGWTGGIFLITNHDVEIEGVSIIKRSFDGKPLTACRLRFSVCNILPIDDYKWWVYLDTDIIIRSDMNRYLGDDHDWAVTECWGRNMWSHSAFGGHLPDEAKEVACRRKGIQSGHLAIQSRCMRQLLKRWSEIDKGKGRPRFKKHDQTSQNALVWECEVGRSPWVTKILPAFFAVAPHNEQLSKLGRERSMGGVLWHYWGYRNQEWRIELMEREVAALVRDPIESGIVGDWEHIKQSENINNIWSFDPYGRVFVDSGLIGTWSKVGNNIKVSWDFDGWERLPEPNNARSLVGESSTRDILEMTKIL